MPECGINLKLDKSWRELHDNKSDHSWAVKHGNEYDQCWSVTHAMESYHKSKVNWKHRMKFNEERKCEHFMFSGFARNRRIISVNMFIVC